MSKWQTRSQRKWSRTLHQAERRLHRPWVEPRPGEVCWISGLDALQAPWRWRVLRWHPRMDCALAIRRRWEMLSPEDRAQAEWDYLVRDAERIAAMFRRTFHGAS